MMLRATYHATYHAPMSPSPRWHTPMCSGYCSLVTWNILAPSFAHAHKYPWASPDQLSWEWRQARIVEQLAAIDADMICLQEVEVALWDELHQRLAKLGYEGILQQTSRGHPVANAVLLRRGLLEFDRSESRSRALITVVRAASAPRATPPLYLSSVHLEAGAEKSATRFAQILSLLRRIELQRAVDAVAEQAKPRALAPVSDEAGAALVLAGDFNCDRSADLHSFLLHGALPDGPRERHGRPAAKMHLKTGPQKRAAKKTPLLPLQDAYLHTAPPWGPLLRSSYRNGRLLDFVWTSPTVDVLRTMPVCDLAGSSQPHPLPSMDHPSDHLPVGALLSWPGAPDAAPSSGARPAWQQVYVENVQRQRQPPSSPPHPRRR